MNSCALFNLLCQLSTDFVRQDSQKIFIDEFLCADFNFRNGRVVLRQHFISAVNSCASISIFTGYLQYEFTSGKLGGDETVAVGANAKTKASALSGERPARFLYADFSSKINLSELVSRYLRVASCAVKTSSFGKVISPETNLSRSANQLSVAQFA